MNKVLASLCAIALSTAVSFAGEEKDLKKMIEDQGIYVETAKKGVVLSGYVDTSVAYTFGGGSTAIAAPGGGGAENALRSFDVESGFSINAFKLALEKALPEANEYGAGFRADLIYGEDARILAASDPGVGTGADGVYLEQAYVQFRAPVGNGLDFKFGKFVTLLGYEVIESPANLNFSRGLLFTNAIPLTHTGALALYKFNDIVDVQGGLVNGWNSSDGFSPALTARLNITAPGGNANIAQSIIYSVGGEPARASVLFTENEPVFTYDIWGNWAPKFANDKLLLGFNGDLGIANDATAGDNSETWFGFALYAKYQFTKMFSLASRAEYLHGENGAGSKFGTGAGTGNIDVYSFTVTAGFNIWENLLTRLEYRADFTEDPLESGIDGGSQHQIALNLVYSF